jgi:hypothetical protein
VRASRGAKAAPMRRFHRVDMGRRMRIHASERSASPRQGNGTNLALTSVNAPHSFLTINCDSLGLLPKGRSADRNFKARPRSWWGR